MFGWFVSECGVGRARQCLEREALWGISCVMMAGCVCTFLHLGEAGKFFLSPLPVDNRPMRLRLTLFLK